jgi:hypothetical protein
MYVNRKKRAVKWVHENGEEFEEICDVNESSKENRDSQDLSKLELKLLTDPRGHVQDMESMKELGYEPPELQSPEIVTEVVNALHASHNKGNYKPRFFLIFSR